MLDCIGQIPYNLSKRVYAYIVHRLHINCKQAQMSVQVCVCMCMHVCVLPEVSVLAVHGHTRTIWTWAGGRNRKREGKEGENGIKKECQWQRRGLKH